MAHSSKPLPMPQPEYDLDNETSFRRNVETNFQDLHAHVEQVSGLIDKQIFSEVMKYQLLMLGGAGG